MYSFAACLRETFLFHPDWFRFDLRKFLNWFASMNPPGLRTVPWPLTLHGVCHDFPLGKLFFLEDIKTILIFHGKNVSFGTVTGKVGCKMGERFLRRCCQGKSLS